MDRITFKPLAPDTWKDFEALFGERGACGGCWCMWWRLKRADFEENKGARNKAAMKRLVGKRETLGILAYAQGKAVGWCAIAPRAAYYLLENSRTLKPVDDKPVWSITCFFVAKPFRRQGLTEKLIRGASAFARKHGAKIVEGYPVVPYADKMPDAFAYTGLPSAFEKTGFKEVARPSRTRPILRKQLR